ncbi:MAG: hypothetical protein CMJ34_09820 [Phycisphaerae bacterium]|nr:hypothetical protein [Phycisphaerae bacterium]
MLIFAGLGLLGLVVVAVDLHRSLRSIEAVPESALDGRRLDPGGATLAEWTLVPGIGPSVAGRIDAARRDGRLGPLQSVSGVGPITLREAAPYLVHPSAAGFRRGSGR